MDNKTKVVKAKGPIRTGALVPAIILFVLLFVYFSFFFDGNLRRGLQYAGTQINGAEVNIGSLRTSFLNASIAVGDIQVTDKNKPHRNIVQIGSIKFKMLWDGLLRAKIVVDEAAILNIQALTERRSPGYVLPPPPPSKEGKSSGTLQKVESEVLEQTGKQFNGNFLGDLASVLGGSDPKEQLKNLQDKLKSSGRIDELKKELEEKKVVWQKKLKEMPQKEEIDAIGKRAKALKFDTKNPVEFAKNLKEAEKIYKEAEAKVKIAEANSKDIKGDINTYTQAVKDLEKLVDEDLKDLQEKFKIPDINGKDFSKQLFMGMLEKRIVGVRKYVEVARKYMPPKKTKEQKLAEKNEQLMPAARGKGRTYRFPVTTGYPLFWLKYAAISSEVNDSEYSGNVKGEIRDLNSDPSFLKKPTTMLLLGDFPKQGISDVNAKITLDHTTDIAKDSLVMKVGSFPTGEQMLSSSKDISLGLKSSVGNSVVEAVLTNDEINMKTRNQFTKIEYDLQSKEKVVKEIIGNVLAGIPMIDVNAEVTGSFSNFDVHLNSNLGEELAKGFKVQVQAKIDKAKSDLRNMINSKIGAQKEQLHAELNKATGGITKDLDGKKAELDKALGDAKAGAKGGGSPATTGKDKLKDEGKKLLKKFGF